MRKVSADLFLRCLGGRTWRRRGAETAEEGTRSSDVFYRMEDTEQVPLAQLTNRTHSLYL